MRFRRPSRLLLSLLVPLLLIGGAALREIKGNASGSSFCAATGTGENATAAVHSYQRLCGPGYVITNGPETLDKRTVGDRQYAQVVEFTLAVSYNSHGNREYLLVGQPHSGGPWTTLLVSAIQP